MNLHVVGSTFLILMNLLLINDKLVTCLPFLFCAYDHTYSTRAHCFFGVRFCLEKTHIVSPGFVSAQEIVFQAETANQLRSSGSEHWLFICLGSAQLATQVYTQFFAIYYSSRLFI